jgi:hypothetical protein
MRRLVMIALAPLLLAVSLAAQQPAPSAPAPVPPGQQTTPPPSRPTTVTPTPGPPQTPAQILPPGQPTGRGQGRGGGRGTAPTPAPGGVAPSVRPEEPSSWQNIKVEVAITDTFSADVQARKTVSMLILDGRNGQVRSSGGSGVLNVDAIPRLRSDGRIYLWLTLEYMPELTSQQGQLLAKEAGGPTGRPTMFNESLSLIVVDGKPLVASQSADPRSERKVAVEVTATVQK